MICKHCGYDVMRGIDYCTNCGEPMPKPKEEEIEEPKVKEIPNLTAKQFNKEYVPYSARLAIHAGAIMSYFYSALYLIPALLFIIAGKGTSGDYIFAAAAIVLAILTFGFHSKKSTACAVLITIVSVVFSIYCFVQFRQITFIWIFAGIMACYGTAVYNKLWKNYKKKGILPKKAGHTTY